MEEKKTQLDWEIEHILLVQNVDGICTLGNDIVLLFHRFFKEAGIDASNFTFVKTFIAVTAYIFLTTVERARVTGNILSKEEENKIYKSLMMYYADGLVQSIAGKEDV